MATFEGTGSREPMLEMFIFETNQMLEQLENILLQVEREHDIRRENINEIFRIMHTIKGSAGMMMFSVIATLAHAVEDLFFQIRETPDIPVDHEVVCDLVLKSADAIKAHMMRIESGEPLPEGEDAPLKAQLAEFLACLRAQPGTEAVAAPPPTGQKQFYISSAYGQAATPAGNRYRALVHFDEGCEMENIRAYSMVFSLQEQCTELRHDPPDLTNDPNAAASIVANGFTVWFTSDKPHAELEVLLQRALFVRDVTLEMDGPPPAAEMPAETTSAPVQMERTLKKPVIHMPEPPDAPASGMGAEQPMTLAQVATGGMAGRETDPVVEVSAVSTRGSKTSLINVNVHKLDKLMDLVGEIVITESMVTRCPELANLQLDAFHKSANQLRKLTDELQDIVMSIRMLPIAATFHKMNRVVRDMGKRLSKEAELVILGEETEVDKNLIDQLADPLMHLVRNAMDHGLETTAERVAAGKPEKGKVVLEARNEGGEVWIQVRDDGKGLDRTRILQKAREHGITSKSDEELTDREIFNFILLPGFSTKEKVSEFSGRGVGMDVVRENITAMGGSIAIESQAGQGTTMVIRIPLTLAIIDGMLVSVGDCSYIIPTMAIRESMRVDGSGIIRDTEGNELMMLRGECYPILRLHRRFGVSPRTEVLEEGILILIEHEGVSLCLFADELLGEQHVVVKPLPSYFRQVNGISGCTILGDGSISLILDVGGLQS